MDITQRELDQFVEQVERLGYEVDNANITSYGLAEVVIYNNGNGHPKEWHYDITDIVRDMGFNDIDILNVSSDYLSAELYG
ncbi:MAG: hypothetical protein CMI60_11400 [Parvibaculum sp.]|nr:hypothetical protein [Parvibaculum sp.]|tara:strand:- start:79 stop:321 length:243 start_codon:yes stop_codon:yes gene_type:complete